MWARNIKNLLCRHINYFICFPPFLLLYAAFHFRHATADPPMCQYEGKVIRAALKQTLNITCDIDSNPMVRANFHYADDNVICEMWF